MKWVPDDTGRFRLRPHYLPNELEQTCEDEILGFLVERHGSVDFPVPTEDLTILIERHTDDFDSSCELPEGVEGLTDFFPRKKPHVKISSRLQQAHLENRLRTTLTHEYGHVRLHGFLFVLEEELKQLFDGKPRDLQNQCRRENIHGVTSDWMEWQAGYACGAFLMPGSELTRVVRAFREGANLPYAEIAVDSDAGRTLIDEVVDRFKVSRDAARVRLEQRKLLVKEAKPSLF